MFIGRKYELNQLDKLYNKPGFQMAIVYGRRKVGKTSLIKEFTKDKRSLYYVPDKHNEDLTLKSFRDLIFSSFSFDNSKNLITNWEEAFKIIADKSAADRIVLVLDDFPSLVEENPSFQSILERVIDHSMKDSQIFLILSGSSNSYIEKQLMSPKSALYGLRTAQMKIEPFNFFDSSKLYEHLPIVDKIKYFATLGGVPQYLLQFDYRKSYDSNVIEFLLNKSSYLYDEPTNYMRTQLKDIKLANNVLSLLSRGDFNLDRLNQKSLFMGEELVSVIKSLKYLNIISRNRSIGRSSTRPWIYYRLEDNFFRFWYRFLYKNKDLIHMGMTDYLFQNKILPDLNSHIGYIFEDICTQFLKKLNVNYGLPFVFENIGGWVGYNEALRKPSQMDIVAVNSDSALIGECKWNKSPINIGTIKLLVDKGQVFKYPNKYYCFFSKSGYDDKSKAYAKELGNVILFSLEDIKE